MCPRARHFPGARGLLSHGQRVPCRWRGDYGGKKQLWFPANYVEELPSPPVPELDEAVGPDQTDTFSASGRSRS